MRRGEAGDAQTEGSLCHDGLQVLRTAAVHLQGTSSFGGQRKKVATLSRGRGEEMTANAVLLLSILSLTSEFSGVLHLSQSLGVCRK